MRKYETIQKIKKEYQDIYKDYHVDIWQGGNVLNVYICDILDINIVYSIIEFEFYYKWNLKDMRTY